MHDCALGREGGPSAPRVEHRYKIAKIATGPKTSGKRIKRNNMVNYGRRVNKNLRLQLIF